MHQSTHRFDRSSLFACILLGAAVSSTACLDPKTQTIADELGDGGSGGNSSSHSGSNGSTSNSSGSGNGSTHGDGGSNSTTGDASSGPPMRGPTPASSTSSFPFPQNRQKSGCVYPAGYLNSDVETAYAKWKTDLVTNANAGSFRRVQRTQSDPANSDGCTPAGSTVSEGIGYGMLIAVYMDDQSLFDDLWNYEQQNLDGTTKLMNWAPGPGTSGPDCTGPAPDADEDMAFALVMADKQWGSSGALAYNKLADTQIQAIWTWEITKYRWLAAGKSADQGGWANNAQENVSYFAPAYYRVFAKADSKACAMGVDASSGNCDGWWGVIDQSYTTIGDSLNSANGNASNGLVPAWCDDSNGAPCKATANASSWQPFSYQYDSCRTPFRIGIDACWNGYAAAQSYVTAASSFFAPIGAAQIVDGYNLNGTPNAAHAGMHSAAFVGPASVGAMSVAADQSFVNDGYALVAQDSAFAGGEYYESSWTVMSLLMLTGNFLDYTQETPAH